MSNQRAIIIIGTASDRYTVTELRWPIQTPRPNVADNST